MTSRSFFNLIVGFYIALFLAFLFLPLIFVMVAAFNDSRFPTMLPWQGFTFRWFVDLFTDQQMGRAVQNSVLIGLGVIALSVPIGLSAALVLYHLHSRARGLIYGVMVSPILTPGVIIGISTLIFWRNAIGMGGGLLLTIIAQTTFIASFAMLLILARLQRFDPTLEEAALDLGATHTQTFFRITLPFLRPAILVAALMAFLQSFDNYNTTLFVIGTETTVTLNIANRVRLGLTPMVNAIGVIFILITIIGAVAYEILRRRERRRETVLERAAAAPA